MRGGVVSFGQGLVFAAGGYAAALLSNKLGVTDALLLAAAGGVAAALLGGALRAAAGALPRHLLRHADAGAVDGAVRRAGEDRRARRLRRLQHAPPDAARHDASPTRWRATCSTRSRSCMAGCLAIAGARLLRLGRAAWCRWRCARTSCASSTSAPRCAALMAANFVLAAFLGGAGRRAHGAWRSATSSPNFSYWTTSGEFVFVAILAGPHSVAAVFVASLRARARALVLQLVLPEHLADGARHLPAAHDPLPAARASARCGRIEDATMSDALSKHAALDKRFGAVVAAERCRRRRRRGRARRPDRHATAPARPPSSTWSPATSSPTPARSRWRAATSPRSAPRAITRLGMARSFQIPQLCADLTRARQHARGGGLRRRDAVVLAAGATPTKTSRARR